MSGLYSLRTAIRALLLQDSLWSADEVLIKRRTNIWNDVAVATAASAAGQCIVVGVAKGSQGKGQNSRQLMMEVTIPITLLELPRVSPDEDELEDVRWEAMVMRLLGDPLGRSPLHYELTFDGFEDAEDDTYVIRQTTFKTNLLLKRA